MELITLDEFKAHARITDNDEIDAAQVKVDAANDYVTGLIDPADGYDAPADVKQATLLIASHWWENRETAQATALADIPLDASAILINHRGWAF